MNLQRIGSLLLGAAVLGGVATAIGFAAFASTTLPEGPVDVVWDKAACAHCSMHLGEPGFAAQLTTTSGDTLFFDDPGCLFEFEAVARPDVHQAWFRHLRDDRWVPADAVAFVATEQSPMGYRLGAVDRGHAASIGIDAARARCLATQDPHGEAHGPGGER